MKVIAQVTVPILRADAPNGNNHVYEMSTLQRIVDTHVDSKVMGQIGMPYSGVFVDVSDVSHSARNFRIVDGVLLADIEVYDTDAGHALVELMPSMSFRTAGTGELVDNVVKEFDLISVNAVSDGAEL